MGETARPREAGDDRTGPALGVRKSSVLIAVAVVFLALLGGGALLVLVLKSALAASAADAATSRTDEIAAVARTGGLPAVRAEVQRDSRPAQLVQVVAPDGGVLVASQPRVARRPMTGLTPPAGQTATAKTDIQGGSGTDDFLVAAQGLALGGRVYVVQVAGPLQVQAQTVRTVSLFLLGAAPLLLLVVGVAVWVLVGRALEPVETIRGQVARIDGRGLSQRVGVPPTRDEIAALADTMNVMLERLEASDQAQRAFVSDAGHELRSPLSSVLAAAELSAADPHSPLLAHRLDTIMLEATRMRFLVDNLMTLARADSHGLDLRRVDVDLDDVVETELHQLRSRTRHQLRCATSPVRIVGDPRRLAQVVRNLLENADRHALSTIEVTLSRDGDAVTLVVDNDGDTIEESMREVVFQRFVRLDDSRSRDSGGSGLGLAISAEIISAHAGSIVASESPAGWCRFQVTLPTRARASATADRA